MKVEDVIPVEMPCPLKHGPMAKTKDSAEHHAWECATCDHKTDIYAHGPRRILIYGDALDLDDEKGGVK